MKIPNRPDAIDRQSRASIDLNRQNLIGVFGRKGAGKSYLTQATATIFYQEAGYTLLDLYASDNWENAFWVIPKLEEHEISDFMKNPNKYNKRTRFPITVICSEALRYDQSKLDKFNGKLFTEKEFYEYYQGEQKYWNCVYPQEKPKSLQGKEWIKFVSLPNPTAKFDSEVNANIAKIIENTILDCRVNGRIFVFNQRAFSNEPAMFRTLEIIFRNIGAIAMKHFRRLTPDEVGVSTRAEMTKKQKAHDKMVFCIREFSDLAPAKLKPDASGESTRVKKSLLSLVRKIRHYQISGICDWQAFNDTEISIRNQFDIFLINKWTERLGGEHFAFAFNKIKYLRNAVFEKYGRNKNTARRIADNMYPPIELLGNQYMYFVKQDDNLKLMKVPEMKTKHKEPYDSFEKFTGIEFWYDKSYQESTSSTDSSSSSRTDEKSLYNAIYAMRYPVKGKKYQWKEVVEKLVTMQEKNEIHYSKPFKDMKDDTLKKWFGRVTKRYEKDETKSK